MLGTWEHLRVFHWMLSTSLKASILIALVLVVTTVLKGKIGPRLHYILWLIVLLRLVVPWTPESSLSVYNFFPVQKTETGSVSGSKPLTITSSNGVEFGAENPTIDFSNDLTPETKKTNKSSGAFPVVPVSKDELLFCVWLAGVLVFGLYTLYVNQRFAKRLGDNLVKDTKVIQAFTATKEKLSIRTDIPLIETAAVNSPSIFGIIRPKLLLPDKIQEKLNSEQLSYVFMHELLHYKHRDLLIRLLMNAVAIVHWFNPFIWYAFNKLQEDQEIVCDAMAIARIGPEKSKEYGYTVITLLEKYASPSIQRVPSLTSLSGSGLQIARRLKMINGFKKASVKWSLLGLVAVSLIVFVTFTNAKDLVKAPITPDKPNNLKPNKLVEVNSLEKVPLNNQLVEAGRKREGTYTFSAENDIASLAYGFNLSALDMGDSYIKNQEKRITESLPANPIFVKSYDYRYPDYYLVPFIREQQFIGQAMWSVEVSNTGTKTGYVFIDNPQRTDLVFPREKLLSVDINDAINILKQTKGINEVPVPRLVYRDSEISKSPMQPFWEFTFKDESNLYVNQSGKVFDSNIIPWYQTYTAPKYNPETVLITANKLVREDFTITLTQAARLQHYQTKKLSGMDVGFTIENRAGIDQNFIPTGKIVGIIGKSGRLYRSNNNPISTLDQACLRIIKMREWKAERDHMPYQPGIFKIGHTFSVDPDDAEISKFVFLDENNQEIEVPVEGIDYQVRDVGNGK